MSQRRAFTWALLAATAGVACSVINSYDEVVPGDGSGGRGGESGRAGSSGMSTGGTGNTDQGGSGAEPSMGGGGTAPMGGEGGEGGMGPVIPDSGLIVLGGKSLDADANVLAVVDPESGEELHRVPLGKAVAVGIAHDGTNDRDAWFVFTASGFPAAPKSVADLQVARFHDARREWTTVARVTAIPPPRPDSFVVLNDRLAYLSYSSDNTTVVDSLTIYDTSDLSALRRVQFDDIDFGGEPIGLVGTRGVPGDPTALGGTLAVLVGVGCAGAVLQRTCTSMNLLPVFVGDEVSVAVPTALPAFGGNPAFASARTQQLAFAAVPNAVSGQSLRLVRFDPRTPDDASTAPVAASRARWVAGLTYAECQQLALFTSLEGTLYAVNQQGLTVSFALDRQGQSLAYDPFTQRIFASYNPNHAVFGPDSGADSGGAGGAGGASGEAEALAAIDAIRMGTSVMMTPASGWTSPENIAPNVIGSRFPAAFECP